MRKMILVLVMFIMFACTLGQTPPKPSATGPTSAPTEFSASNALQPAETPVVESGLRIQRFQAGPREAAVSMPSYM